MFPHQTCYSTTLRERAPAAFNYKLGVLDDETSELGKAYSNLVYVFSFTFYRARVTPGLHI